MYYSLSFIQPTNPYSFNRYTDDAIPPLDLTFVRNTWEHWRIVPTERPTFAPPPLNTHVVNVDGANGNIDLTQALTGYPTYGNRSGSFDFAVINDYRNWQQAYTDILSTIHGKRLYCVYEEDPEWYYVGRWTVKSWVTGKNRSTVTLTYDLEPYKLRLYDLNSDWLWDPFNFQNGIITSRYTDADGAIFTKSHRVDSSEWNDCIIFDTSKIIGEWEKDAVGDGYIHKQDYISSILGNMPVALWLDVKPDSGETIQIQFKNSEINYGDEESVFKTYTSDYQGTDPSYIITNYSGTNSILMRAIGKGQIEVNFRPGRL